MTNRNIVLIGMMGCGKSSVGKELGSFGRYKFLDMDLMIESRCQMTIPHIFERYGELYFRTVETETAREAASRESVVIATGGGVILKHENMEALRTNGFVVYLQCRPQVLLDRVKGDKGRPLLNAASEKEKLLEKLLTEREPLYKQYSDYIIDANESSKSKLAKAILEVKK